MAKYSIDYNMTDEVMTVDILCCQISRGIIDWPLK